MEAQRSQFQQEQQANIDTIANLRQIEAQVATFREAAQKDVQEQVQRYREAYEKYQSELVSHADDIKALNEVRERLNAVQTALDEANRSAEAAQGNLGSAQSSWDVQRAGLQQELDEQKKR